MRVSGTSTSYAQCASSVMGLAAGVYELGGIPDGMIPYLQVKSGSAIVLSSVSKPQATLTVEQTASPVLCQIVVAPNQTVDSVITPTLVRVG
ncbi:hypothetical protein [Bifidobacterium tissieri]|uniref:Uncharacterized protein n=1 Tax=Bifidobacterium tissieri TaxID=1630162 RepID=A0A5M9ZVM2_9BIFI|nr:hypothetical protein [Bifidobacterium tissieri]KAA8829348.1 hypothetical protein EM849_11120 [Bifidobacterium tissieri]KAA8831661.1 hypothetical protein EMO89_02760 [Bifidobacterium tissieri]